MFVMVIPEGFREIALVVDIAGDDKQVVRKSVDVDEDVIGNFSFAIERDDQPFSTAADAAR